MARLDERKRRVLELLTLGGLTQKKAGKTVGVRAETISEWKREDPEFRRQLEEWRTGPPPDALTLAQSRRIIIDELARRVLHERSKLTIRELLTIHDRLDREGTGNQEERDDDDIGSTGGATLTPQEAERLWADIDRETRRPEEDTPAQQTQS